MAEILRKSNQRMTPSGRRLVSLLAMTICAGHLIAAAGTAVDAEQQLAAAVRVEIVVGDLKDAMKRYRSILDQQPKSRAVAARAWFQLARCLEKDGQRTEAFGIYNSIAAQYRDQAAVAALVRTRLANAENSIPGPSNLTFAQGVPGKLPPAWFVPALPTEADQWAQVRSNGCMGSEHCAVVLVPANAPVHVSNLMQSFNATAYRGKTIAFRAWIRLEARDSDDRAQIWLSEERSGDKKGFFDDAGDRPVRSSEWTQREITTRIDTDATSIKFGVMSVGRGTVWVDRVAFDIVSSPAAN